jgi:Zn-dependent M28 family amino/carboxypeptidase
MDDILRAAAAEQGRILKPDPKPENGSFFRSDHFPFVKRGVPALNPGSGVDFIDRPADWGLKTMEDFIKNDYHKPSDKVRPDWTMDGAVEDLRLYLAVGYRVANAALLPEWKPGSDFAVRRNAPPAAKK